MAIKSSWSAGEILTAADLTDTFTSKLTTPGAWTAWTPTWTGLTVGNATQAFAYAQYGKLIVFRGKLTVGTTTTFGSSTDFSLPVANNAALTIIYPIGIAHYYNNTVVNMGRVLMISSSTARCAVENAAGTYVVNGEVSSTSPFSWASTHTLFVSGFYEAS